MKKSIIISMLFVAVLLWAFSAEAQWWGRGGGGRGAGPCWQNDTYGLNLTQDQTAKLNSLHQAFWKDTAALNTRIEQKQLELKGLLMESTPDAGKIASLQKETPAFSCSSMKRACPVSLKREKSLPPSR
jgi:Spy/CpxP family protein refolding chaperone